MNSKKGILWSIFILSIIIAITITSEKKQDVKISKIKPANTIKKKDRDKTDKQFEKFLVGKQNVKAMLLDRGTLWIGTSGTLLHYNIKNKNTTIYNNKNGLLSNGILCIKKIDGKIWVGTYGGGISVFDGNEWSNINVDKGLADSFVYDIIKLEDEIIWIATWSGANYITGDIDNINSWNIYTYENTDGGLANDWVYAISKGVDKGTMWFGTESGLSYFDGRKWTSWNHEDGQGAPYEVVEEYIEFKRDPAKESKHHAKQKEEMELYYGDVSYNPNYIVSMEIDSKGRVYVGTWGGGLSILEKGRYVRTYTIADGLSGNYIFMVKEGPSGAIWIGTENGLSRFDGKDFKNFSKSDGLVSNRVFSIAFVADRSILVGSYGGVTFFRQGLE